MASNLDLSLDDIIKSNKTSKRGQRPSEGNNARGGGQRRGRGGGAGHGNGTSFSSGPGPSRRVFNRAPLRTAPYAANPQASGWQHQFLTSGGSGGDSATKLYLSNLHYGVSNEDIKILFSEVGELKRYSIHYDRNGRSKGTAEVVFVQHSDAVAAIKRYNNVQLDGKPMKLELVGVNVVAPAAPPATMSAMVNARAPQRSVRERIGDVGIGAGRGRQGFGRGRGQGGAPSHEKKKVSAEDLDAELEKYHLEAMQIN